MTLQNALCELCGMNDNCATTLRAHTLSDSGLIKIQALLSIAPRSVAQIANVPLARKHGNAVVECERRREQLFNAAWRILEFIVCDLDAPRNFHDPRDAHHDIPSASRPTWERAYSAKEIELRIARTEQVIQRRAMQLLALHPLHVADERASILRGTMTGFLPRLHWRTLAERLGFNIRSLEETLRLWKKQRFGGMGSFRIQHIELVREFYDRLHTLHTPSGESVKPDVYAAFDFMLRNARSTVAPRKNKAALQHWLSALRIVSRHARDQLRALYSTYAFNTSLTLIRRYVRAAHALHACPTGCDCGADNVVIGGAEAEALHATIHSELTRSTDSRIHTLISLESNGLKPFLDVTL